EWGRSGGNRRLRGFDRAAPRPSADRSPPVLAAGPQRARGRAARAGGGQPVPRAAAGPRAAPRHRAQPGRRTVLPVAAAAHAARAGMILEGKNLRVEGRLSGVSVTLAPGGITAICGPNGAGKSSLLQCLAGLLAPDDGAVTL